MNWSRSNSCSKVILLHLSLVKLFSLTPNIQHGEAMVRKELTGHVGNLHVERVLLRRGVQKDFHDIRRSSLISRENEVLQWPHWEKDGFPKSKRTLRRLARSLQSHYRSGRKICRALLTSAWTMSANVFWSDETKVERFGHNSIKMCFLWKPDS